MNKQYDYKEEIENMLNNDSKKSTVADFATFAAAQNELKKPVVEGFIDNSLLGSEIISENLPELLKDCCAVFKTVHEKDVFLTGALPVLSGCFGNVTGIYDGCKVNANLYCFVVAPPASGKGVMNKARKLGNGIHERLLAESTVALSEYKAKLKVFGLEKKGNQNEIVFTDVPKEPATKMLFIPANSSSAAIIKHIDENNGCGVMFETEADTLTNTFKQEWGCYSDLLRKAFHQEAFSYSRKANNEFIEIQRPNISVALSGTPNQVGRLLVSNEDGLVSRFIFYCFEVPAEWHDVSPQSNIDFDAFFNKIGERVYQIHNDLKGKTIKFQFSDEQFDLHGSFMSGKLYNSEKELHSSVFRMGLIIFKIAMVLSVLSFKEQFTDNKTLECSDNDFQVAIALGEKYLLHAELAFRTLLKPRINNIDNSKIRFFEALPAEFERMDAIAIGSSFTFSTRLSDTYLRILTENGKLDKLKTGTYRKL